MIYVLNVYTCVCAYDCVDNIIIILYTFTYHSKYYQKIRTSCIETCIARFLEFKFNTTQTLTSSAFVAFDIKCLCFCFITKTNIKHTNEAVTVVFNTHYLKPIHKKIVRCYSLQIVGEALGLIFKIFNFKIISLFNDL